MKVKLILCMAMTFYTSNLLAQLVVKINDKNVGEGQLITADSIRKMELRITKPVLLKTGSKGKARLYVELLGSDGKVVEGYTYEKEGYAAVDLFLKDTKTSYTVYEEGGENKTFGFTLNAPPTLKAVLEQAGTNPVNKLIKVKISLMFSDKTIDNYGAVQYGYMYDLVPVFQFVIKNENSDGSFSLLEVGSTFTNTVAVKVQFKEQKSYKGYFYDEVNPLFTSKDVIKCNLQGKEHYMPVIFNIIDIKDKTQDEYVTDLKNSFEAFLISMSNQCNDKIAQKLPEPKYTDWGSVISFSNRNERMIIPSLDGRNNKGYLTEPVMKPADLGRFKGFKFNSFVLEAICGLPFKDFPNWGNVNVYFLKHPKNAGQVLMVFAFDKDPKQTREDVKITEDRIDLFLSSQRF